MENLNNHLSISGLVMAPFYLATLIYLFVTICVTRKSNISKEKTNIYRFVSLVILYIVIRFTSLIFIWLYSLEPEKIFVKTIWKCDFYDYFSSLSNTFFLAVMIYICYN